MKRMFDFVCLCGQRIEKLTDYETDSVQCGDCGSQAYKTISAPAIKLEGWSGSFPGAANKFDRIHREKLAAEQKANS
jgi:predicted nucleic acid-binding Zn ribbon protein